MKPPRYDSASMMKFQDHVRRQLATLRPRTLTEGYTHEAAVLMLLYEHATEPHILLTRRTDEVETHKGQVSFPGGMKEDGENLEETALRETREEVGIDTGQIELLGRFHDYLSITRFRVCTFAGFIQAPFATSPHAKEVAEVLHVPLSIFQDHARVRVDQLFRFGRWMDIYHYAFGPHDIWGLTALIIRDFLIELGWKLDDHVW